jgi:hypothetical protein
MAAARYIQHNTDVTRDKNSGTVHSNSNRAARYEVASMHVYSTTRKSPIATADAKVGCRGRWRQQEPEQSSQYYYQHSPDESNRGYASGTPTGCVVRPAERSCWSSVCWKSVGPCGWCWRSSTCWRSIGACGWRWRSVMPWRRYRR